MVRIKIWGVEIWAQDALRYRGRALWECGIFRTSTFHLLVNEEGVVEDVTNIDPDLPFVNLDASLHRVFREHPIPVLRPEEHWVLKGDAWEHFTADAVKEE